MDIEAQVRHEAARRQEIVEEIMRLKSAEDELRTVLNTLVHSQTYLKQPSVLENRLSNVSSYPTTKFRLATISMKYLRKRQRRKRDFLNYVTAINKHILLVINKPDLLAQKAYEGILTIDDLKTVDYTLKSSPDMESLKGIYVSFCSFSSPLVIDRLTQPNFLRFLKACKIFDDCLVSTVSVVVISQGTAQSIYVKLSKEKNLSYLTYDMFLNALEQIAELKFPLTFAICKNTALKLLLNVHIFPNAASGATKKFSPEKSTSGASFPSSATRNVPTVVISTTYDNKREEKSDQMEIKDQQPQNEMVRSFGQITETETQLPKIFENKRLRKVLNIVFEHYMNKDVRASECMRKIAQEWFLKMMQNFKICPLLCPKVVLRSYSGANIGRIYLKSTSQSGDKKFIPKAADFEQFLRALVNLAEYVYRAEESISTDKKVGSRL